MKTLFRVLAVLLIVCGVLSLLMSALFFYAHGHTMDGSSSMYAKQWRMAILHLIAGLILLLLGIGSAVLRRIK